MVAAAGPGLWAAEAAELGTLATTPSAVDQEQQFALLAKARASADLALRRARDFEADSNNAWHNAADLCQTAHDKAAAAIEQQINEEDRKDDADKSAAKLDALHTQHDKLEADWRHFTDAARPALEQRWQAAFNRLHAAQDAFDALAGNEHSWKDAGLALAPLAESFDAIAKLTAEVRAEATKMLGEFTEQQKAWEKRAAAPPAPPQ
jgi:hypothetical protein